MATPTGKVVIDSSSSSSSVDDEGMSSTSGVSGGASVNESTETTPLSPRESTKDKDQDTKKKNIPTMKKEKTKKSKKDHNHNHHSHHNHHQSIPSDDSNSNNNNNNNIHINDSDDEKPMQKVDLSSTSISFTEASSSSSDDEESESESASEKDKEPEKRMTLMDAVTHGGSSSNNNNNNSASNAGDRHMNAEAANQPEVLFETKRMPKLRVETEGKVLLRVYFVDDSFKTVFVNPETTTIEEIWGILCEKLQLPPNEWSCFFIFGVSPNLDILMYADSTVSGLLQEWPLLESQFSYQQPLSSSFRNTFLFSTRKSTRSTNVEYNTFQELPMSTTAASSSSSSSSSTPRNMTALNHGVTKTESTLSKLTRTLSMTPRRAQQEQPMELQQPQAQAQSQASPRDGGSYFKLMLKPTTILPLQEEAGVASPSGINLFYLQAVYDTIESHYPTTAEDAVTLAGMQMYVTNGAYDPAVHKPGFLAPNLESFVPKHIFAAKKVRRNAAAWEEMIYAEQRRLGTRDRLEVMNMYLAHARAWPCYGATFFNVVHNPPNMGFYRQKGLGDVVLGINRLGLHIIDAKEMGANSTPITFYKWEEITSWDSDEETFFFEYIRPGMSEPSMVSLDTSQGDYINDLMHDWMDEIETAIVKTNQFLLAQQEMDSQSPAGSSGDSEKKPKKKKKSHKKKKHSKE